MRDGSARQDTGREPIGYAALVAYCGLECPPPRQSLAVGPGVHRVVEAERNTEWRVLPRGSAIRSYFDVTRQAEYLADRIEHTIQFAVPAELLYLHRFDDAKRRVAAVADRPDRLATLLIQFCIQNGGTVSARKRAEFFPGATDGDMAELEAAVRDSGIVPVAAPLPTPQLHCRLLADPIA